jgi:DNA polymerase
MDTGIWYNFNAAFDCGCSRCSLSDHGCPPIVYRGNPNSDILLIGEAPGKIEQEQMKPFVGPAGELLDNIMKAIGLSTEEDMIIMNTVFCRPTAHQSSGKQNYTPKKEQIVRCWPFVEKAISLLKPKIIIACGRTALSQLTGDTSIRIGQGEGKWMSYKYLVPFPPPTRGSKVEEVPMFVMTHPAAILHKAKYPEEQRTMKLKVWEYMKYFRDTYKV